MSFSRVGYLSVLVVAIGGLLLCGCEDDHETEVTGGHVHADDHEDEAACEGEVVHMDEKASANLNVETKTIELEICFDRIKIPGTVAVDPDRRAQVSLPATVRVLELNAPLHSTVKAGQQLAVLELVDPEMNQLQIRAVELRAELLAAQTELDRMRVYLAALPAANANGGDHESRRVEADLAVAEAGSNSLQSSLAAVLKTLQISGLSRSQLKELADEGKVTTHLSVYAPMLPGSPSLEVAVRPIVLGETIPAGNSLFELVAMDRLLVIGDAFESDLAIVSRAVRENLPVSLLFPSADRQVDGLRVLAVEGALDGLERITHFLVPVPNQLLSEKEIDGVRYCDWEIRAGSRVQVLVATQEVGQRFVLPSAAVVRDCGHFFVFKKVFDGYERVEIHMERQEGRHTVLTRDCGLSVGDRIVTRGALQLNLIMKKQDGAESAGNDHGHAH